MVIKSILFLLIKTSLPNLNHQILKNKKGLIEILEKNRTTIIGLKSVATTLANPMKLIYLPTGALGSEHFLLCVSASA